ncbi:kinase-like domain-containing protein [Mycena rebaudengoi]|nr:kinase-like domain-containing protein [Mycena rebaudengoi]
MLEIYSLRQLRSLPWHLTCNCLERTLNEVSRPVQYSQPLPNDFPLARRIMDALIVSPWPLVFWIAFRLIKPALVFQDFLITLRAKSTAEIFAWDAADESWLLERLLSPPSSASILDIPLFPSDTWSQFAMELDPENWKLIHNISWTSNLRRRRLSPEYDAKLRLAAVFGVFAHPSPPVWEIIREVLVPLRFSSEMLFFSTAGRLDVKAGGLLEPSRQSVDSESSSQSVSALRRLVKECDETLCRIASSATRNAGVLDRLESMHLVLRLNMPKYFVLWAFTCAPHHHESSQSPSHDKSCRMDELRKLVGRWAEWDMLTSLANYYSVIETLFKFVADCTSGSVDRRAASEEMFLCLSRDLSAIFSHFTLILSDPTTYKAFLGCRGTRAQQLLDLLQDLLDYDNFSLARPHLSKALLRLSRASGLHPRCASLSNLQIIGHQVAGGGFGDIFKGLVGGRQVCVKAMRIFNGRDVEEVSKSFGHEALIWRQLSHPNLLPFFGLFRLENRLCLVSPWMENGNILQFLKKETVSDAGRISLMLDIAMGIEYLHKRNVVHGDLKAINILVTPSRRACITDFGLSTITDFMTSLQFTHSTEALRGGTTRWQAPELLCIKNPDRNHFGSDIYAFACVCYEIITEKPPFYEITNQLVVMNRIIDGERPSRPANWAKTPPLEAVWNLLQRCWEADRAKRPDAAQIIKQLSSAPILARTFQSASFADWDEASTSKFRRSLQPRPLLPSVTQIESRVFGEVAEAPKDEGSLRTPS